MTTITVTRRYSGFQNVEDRFVLGDHQEDGHASIRDYELPDGYWVDAACNCVRDPAGVRCVIALLDSAVTLMSLTGPCPNQQLRRIDQ